MDPSIKQYADPLYEKALFESGGTVRRESVKYFQERAKAQDHRQPFSGADYQAQVRIFGEHIERVTAARLDSYQKAFGEINRLPTEAELNEILNDFKATWELQIKHANQALSGSLIARNAPTGLDLTADLMAHSAHGHDRVLQEWKIWRGRVLLLQKVASDSEGRSLNSVSAVDSVGQSHGPKPLPGSAFGAGPDTSGHRPVAFISYSWDSDTHKDWVFNLANRLQGKDGVQIILDQWHLPAGHDKAIFMEKSVTRSDFVILICTPDYARKADSRVGGVGYEATIITGELAENISQGKFIPVLRQGEWKSSLPVWIKTKSGIDLRNNPYSDDQYEDLLRALHNEPRKPPPVGPKPDFRDRQSVSQEIVPPKWAGRAMLDEDLTPYDRKATENLELEADLQSRDSAIRFVHRMVDRGSGEERKQTWEQRPDIVLEWTPGKRGGRDKGTFRNIGKRSGFSMKTGSFSWPELQFVVPVQVNAIHPDTEVTVELPVVEKTGPGSILVGSLDSFMRDQKFKERDDLKLTITFSDSEGHSFEREFEFRAGPGGSFGPLVITSLGPLRQL